MKSKMTMVIVACCMGIIVGIIIGGLMRQSSGGIPASEEGRATAPRLAEEVEDSSDGIPAVVAENKEVEDSSGGIPASDDEEDRMARGRIQMQQSADEVRQAIIDNANLNDAQAAQLDKMVESMNQNMLDVSTKWADRIRETGTLDMDTRLRMQHDINGVSVSFSDKMDTAFPGWRGEDVDLTRLVRVTTAFEPFRKIRSEILRGEMGGKTNTENTEDTEGDE